VFKLNTGTGRAKLDKKPLKLSFDTFGWRWVNWATVLVVIFTMLEYKFPFIGLVSNGYILLGLCICLFRFKLEFPHGDPIGVALSTYVLLVFWPLIVFGS
jgi:hypothetical protein